ncbi:MAG: Alkaline phosphatase synthesis sensor protein PhoR [Tenericutes bacterium ADurb.Bin239]|nr:MAG: Alkaline phosphatase synthesis sensor protein PhoR [Tenericutes bacterium ADurb.Bin239]
MKKKLIFTNVIVILLAVVSVILTSSIVLYKHEYAIYSERANNFLSLTSSYFTGANFDETKNIIRNTNSDVRLTIVSLTGEVVADTHPTITNTNNQLERPELQSENLGKIITRRATDNKQMMMYVAGLDNGYYLIISLPFNVGTKINMIILWGVGAFLLISGVSSLLIYLLNKKSTTAISTAMHKVYDLIDSDVQEVSDTDEIPEIMDLISQKLSRKIDEISAKNEEIITVLDTLKQGIALISKTGRLILINEQLKRIFDIESNVINRHYVNIIRDVKLQNLIDDGLKKRVNSKYLYYDDGKAIKCLLTPVDMSWLSGGLIVTFEDITIEHNVDKTKKDFFQNASHELKSPLTSIIGYQQMITEGIATDLPVIRDYAYKTLSEASRMRNILLDMLDLAMLEQDYKKNEEKVRLDLVVRDIVESMEDRMNEKDVALRLDLEKTEINSEYKLIDELVRNLIDNAIKYNKEKGSIKVSLKKKILAISDTGIGIAEDDKRRVFERFYRVDKGRSKARGGTGLGLAIVKHICELYSYKINLSSHIGKGTTITIDFNETK